MADRSPEEYLRIFIDQIVTRTNINFIASRITDSNTRTKTLTMEVLYYPRSAEQLCLAELKVVNYTEKIGKLTKFIRNVLAPMIHQDEVARKQDLSMEEESSITIMFEVIGWMLILNDYKIRDQKFKARVSGMLRTMSEHPKASEATKAKAKELLQYV